MKKIISILLSAAICLNLVIGNISTDINPLLDPNSTPSETSPSSDSTPGEGGDDF